MAREYIKQQDIIDKIVELMKEEPRLEKGWSQKDLAGRLGYNIQQINNAVKTLMRRDVVHTLFKARYILNDETPKSLKDTIRLMIDLLIKEPRKVTGWDVKSISSQLNIAPDIVSQSVRKLKSDGFIIELNYTRRYTLNEERTEELYKRLLITLGKKTFYIDTERVGFVGTITQSRKDYEFMVVVGGCDVIISHDKHKEVVNARNAIIKRLNRNLAEI